MKGMIRARDVIAHPAVVIRGFGLKVFLRALLAPKERTFLEIISEGIPHPASPEERAITQQLDRLVLQEIHCSKIYKYFADHFLNFPDARQFFQTLSFQEEAHAEIIRVAKVEIARRKIWPQGDLIAPDILEKTDAMLARLDAGLRQTPRPTLKQALEMLEEMEATEREMVFAFLRHFHDVVQFTFIQKMHLLIPSFADHNAYLNTMLPQLKEMATRDARQQKRGQG